MNISDPIFKATHTRSIALYKVIEQDVYMLEHSSDVRDILTKCLAGISFEHSNSIMQLIAINNYTTAIALLRLQYEAVARSMWLHFAAKDTFLDKYAAPIDVKNLPPDFPTIKELISEISRGQVKGPAEMLQSFKDVSWSGMNSYVHNGFLPIERFMNGYPEQLLIQIMQSSNALNTMIAMVLARMTGDIGRVSLVKQLQVDFQDCLPKLEPISSS